MRGHAIGERMDFAIRKLQSILDSVIVAEPPANFGKVCFGRVSSHPGSAWGGGNLPDGWVPMKRNQAKDGSVRFRPWRRP